MSSSRLHPSFQQPSAGLLIEAAGQYISCGISVLPVAPRSKFPDPHALRRSGNANLFGQPSWFSFTRRLARPEEIAAWFGSGSGSLGIVTGYRDLMILDFDDMHAYAAWTSAHGAISQRAPLQRTHNGIHVLLRWQAVSSTRLSTNSDFVLTDAPAVRVGQIKGASDYVVAWPSFHPSGSQYTWEPARAPWETPPPRIESLEDIGVKQARQSWSGYLAFLPRLASRPVENIPVLIRWIRNKTAKLTGVFSKYG